MITITNTITMTIITMAIITMAIITISPGPNALTWAQNRSEAGCCFCRKIWVGDLLSATSKCLPRLNDSRRQLSTLWQWGIMRSHHGGPAKDKVQTMISTNVMISTAATCLPPPTSQYLAPPTQQVSGSSTQEHRWEHIVKMSCLLRVYLGACLGVCLRASWLH